MSIDSGVLPNLHNASASLRAPAREPASSWFSDRSTHWHVRSGRPIPHAQVLLDTSKTKYPKNIYF
jgi:hypothetical protein